jgi:hypothetical protein
LDAIYLANLRETLSSESPQPLLTQYTDTSIELEESVKARHFGQSREFIELFIDNYDDFRRDASETDRYVASSMNAPWFDVVWRILKRDHSLPEEMKAPPCLVRRLHNLSPPSLPAMVMICMLWDLLHPSLTIRLQQPSKLRKKLPPLRTR